MKNTSKTKGNGKKQSPKKLSPGLLLGGLVLIAGVEYLLYCITGCVPLLLAALIALLPALVQLPLLLPAKKLVRKGKPELLEWIGQHNSLITAGVIVLLSAVIHVFYWIGTANQTKPTEGYYVPVVLAVLIVLSVIAEKTARHTAAGEDAYHAAVLGNLCSAFVLTRWLLILLTAATVIRLLGWYDPENILKVVLGAAFIYETARILWSLIQRLVRKELETAPELSLSLFGAKAEDTDLLTYMEENTGITMRSLWSMRYIMQLLPAAVMGVALVLWLSTGIVTVDANEEGALYRAGKLQAQTLQPGLHLTFPWPIDRVEIYDTQSVGTLTIGYVPEGEMDNLWTEDHGIEEYRLLLGSGDEMVSINMKVQYKIENLFDYISSSAAPESLLQAKAYEIVTERTIVSDLETLLAVDRKAFSDSFQQELTEKIASHNTGLQVVDVVLESIHPPIEVADVYQSIISAGIAADELIINAENSANRSVLEAEADYITAVSDATVAQYEAIAAAKAEVAEFMASVAADTAYSDEYRFYKYMNALMQAYGNAKLILVGEGVDTANLYIGSLNLGSAETETN